MRCDCCNKRLTDFEATLKHSETGAFMNTCKKCLKGLGIQTQGRSDLAESFSMDDEWDDDLYDSASEESFQEEVHKLMYDNPMEDM